MDEEIKKETTVETPGTETPQPTEKEEAQKIVLQQLETFIGEPLEKEPNKVEKKAEELKVEKKVEPVVEEKVVEKQPEFNPAKFEETITQKITDTILKTLGGKKEEEVKEESPWAKEKRNPKSYDEIAEWVAKLSETNVLKTIESKQQAKIEEEKKITEETAKMTKETEQKWHTYWDGQVNKLQTAEKIGKTPEDVQEFWRQVATFNNEQSKAGKPIVTDLTEFALLHYKAPVKEVKGADAPIIGPNTNTASVGKDKTYSYVDIHNANSLADLV